MAELFALYLFSCWHVLMPGHSKTLIVAAWLSGISRKSILRVACGYGLSHGFLMAAAVVAGIILTRHIESFLQEYAFWAGNLYLPVLFFAGIYFLIKAMVEARKERVDGGGHGPIHNLFEERPFIMGLGLGFIPCGSVVGLALISPALMKARSDLWGPFFAVWLGVASVTLGIAFLLGAVPAGKLMKRLPGWLPFAAAAALCLGICVYRGFSIWQDLLYLYG